MDDKQTIWIVAHMSHGKFIASFITQEEAEKTCVGLGGVFHGYYIMEVTLYRASQEFFDIQKEFVGGFVKIQE